MSTQTPLYKGGSRDSLLGNQGEGILNSPQWLPLIEYSGKYRVSMSTLRRRIKAGEIEYKFADGKYLLKDGPLNISSGTETIAPPTSMSQIQGNEKAPVMPTVIASIAPAPVTSDSHWETTHALLAEIKKAYSLVLEEKEEMILQLKEEISDLKTLVRVLEDETLRPPMKKSGSLKSDFDLDLELGLEI
jgi:hypothetical protein